MPFQNFVCFVAMFSFGCTTVHIISETPERDSGPVIAGDAGIPPADAFVADSGPFPIDAATVVDASTDAPDLTVTLYTIRLGDRVVGLGTTYVWMTVAELTAGAEDVDFTGIRFHHRGVGSTDDIPNVYLFRAQDRIRLTTARSINRVTGEVVFHTTASGAGITIHAGETIPFAIVGDLSISAVPGSTHAFDIESADDVFTLRPARISGAFPLRGATVTLSPLIPERADLRAGTGVDFGYGERGIISRFTVTGENIYLDRISLIQGGSLPVSSLLDLELFVDGVPSGDAYVVDSPYSPFIALDFDNPTHTGVHVNGTSEVTVTALVTDPGYDATIRTYVEYQADVIVGDDVIRFDGIGSGARVCISSSPYAGCDASDAASFDGTTPGTYFEVTVR